MSHTEDPFQEGMKFSPKEPNAITLVRRFLFTKFMRVTQAKGNIYIPEWVVSSSQISVENEYQATFISQSASKHYRTSHVPQNRHLLVIELKHSTTLAICESNSHSQKL